MISSRTSRFAAAAAFVLVPAAMPASLAAQTTPVPRPAAGQTVPATSKYTGFDPTHLKERPYSFNLPKPQFPSTDRTDREFVVEYVYDYAFSRYTPEVKLPVVGAAAVKRDTPENALIALTSAMRQGDFPAFVKCWDVADQKNLLADAKDKGHDAAFWKKIWAQVFAPSKETILLDRIETQSYVILDYELNPTGNPGASQVFKFQDGEWQATNELSRSAMLYPFTPDLAGVIQRFEPLPPAKISPDAVQLLDAQQDFLTQHTVRERVVLAGH